MSCIKLCRSSKIFYQFYPMIQNRTIAWKALTGKLEEANRINSNTESET